LRAVIRRVIASSGVPAVLVTHDLEEAEELGDIIISYDNGRVAGMRIIERPDSPTPQPRAPEEPDAS
jgi:ABC-type sulfate/molybdate transport systems ATPase subunit